MKNNLSSYIAVLLNNNPQILELLVQGLANVSAVAQGFQEELERECAQRLSINAIGMAIRRYVSTLPVSKVKFNMPQPFEMAIRTGIYEVALRPSISARRALEAVRKTTSEISDCNFTALEGIYEIVVYINQKYKAIVKKAFKKLQITSEVDNLACVSCNWAPNTKDMAGIYYRITRALAVKNISIQSFHTIGAEMSIFVKADKIMAAHEALQFLVASSEH